MTAIATGVFKQLVASKQSGLGVKASAAGAQLFRRVTSTIDLKKTSYTSKEIRPSQQRSDMRHGVLSVDGTITGELSVGTYQNFMGSVLRNAWAATTPITGASLTIAGTLGAYTITGTGFITGGLKIGDVIQLSVGTLNVNNIGKNLLITGLTATVITVATVNGSAMTAEGPITGCTITVMGKKCWIPTSGQTRDYWTIEHNFADIAQSEQFRDCVFGDMNIKLPATGMATVDFPVKGINMDSSTAAYFTTPAAASTGAILAAVNGAVYVQGVAVGYITSFDISVKGNMTTPGGVVGANVEPDIFPGAFDITGSATVLFANNTMRDYFVNETEVSLSAVFTTNNLASAGFIAITLPRVKFSGASKDDGEKGLSMTMPFTALENINGGAAVNTTDTTIIIQDSAAV
ncbi:MAG: phage tail tube protein [Gallionella sp.]|nr:phage tail tube protein [Gallionella sp.]